MKHFKRGVVQADVVVKKAQRQRASHARGTTTDNGHCIVRPKDISLVQRSHQAERTILLAPVREKTFGAGLLFGCANDMETSTCEREPSNDAGGVQKVWKNVQRYEQHDIERQEPCSSPPCFRAVGPGIEGSGLCYTEEQAEELVRRAVEKIRESRRPPDDDDSEEPTFRL